MNFEAIIKATVENSMDLEKFDKTNTEKSFGKITYLKDVPTATLVYNWFLAKEYNNQPTNWGVKVSEYNSVEMGWVNFQMPTNKTAFDTLKKDIDSSIAEITKVNPESKIIKKLQHQMKMAEFFMSQPTVSKTAMMHVPAIITKNNEIEASIEAGNSITVYGPWLKSANAPRSFSPKLMKIILLQFQEGLARLQRLGDKFFDSRGAISKGTEVLRDNMEANYSWDKNTKAIVLNHTPGVVKDVHHIRACVSIHLPNYRKSFLKLDEAKMTEEQREVWVLFVKLWTFVLQNGWNSIKRQDFTGVVVDKAKHGEDITQVKEAYAMYPSVANTVKPKGERTNSEEWKMYRDRRVYESVIIHYYIKRMVSINKATAATRDEAHSMKDIGIVL